MVPGGKVCFDAANAQGRVHGQKVLVKALRSAWLNPTRASVLKALETLDPFDLGGDSVAFSRANRVGSRFVEVTVISSAGKC